MSYHLWTPDPPEARDALLALWAANLPIRGAPVLDLKVPDRVPVALHNFLMACHMTGGDFSQILRSGEMLAQAQLAAWREFGHDVIMHENGVCAEAEAMGCGLIIQPAALRTSKTPSSSRPKISTSWKSPIPKQHSR